MTSDDIKKLRKRLRLSAQEFARALGLADGRLIRRWETGDVVPGGTAITLMELAEELPDVRAALIERAGWSAHSPAHQGNHDANQRHD